MSEEQIDPLTEGAEAAAPEAPAQDALQKERDDLYDRLLRKTAEFDNFRKRVERDRKEMIEYAAAEVLDDLLAIVDDFDRALAADAPPEAAAFKTGLEMIHRQLAELLKKRGVATVEALGADFSGTSLAGTFLRGAFLAGAFLAGAFFAAAFFAGAVVLGKRTRSTLTR